MVSPDQRQLGATGLSVPALGVGVWSWGDKRFWGYGSGHSYDDVVQAYKVCLDAGLNFFDTAEVYGQGESERILGECAREDGRPIIIASKFAPFPSRLSPRAVLEALDKTLERLGVTAIDLYQVHWPYTLMKQNALMDALAEAVRSKKVKSVGVSNYSADLMRKAHARLARYDIPLASNQVHYSLLHRKPESNGVLDACRELNVALIAYSPLEQGLLTGKYRSTTQLAVLPWPRRLQNNFRSGSQQKFEPLLSEMEQIGLKHEKSIAQVALNWLLCKDECIIPIPGAKNERQARENAGALNWKLTPAEVETISTRAQF